jgi:hypothetical protein
MVYLLRHMPKPAEHEASAAAGLPDANAGATAASTAAVDPNASGANVQTASDSNAIPPATGSAVSTGTVSTDAASTDAASTDAASTDAASAGDGTTSSKTITTNPFALPSGANASDPRAVLLSRMAKMCESPDADAEAMSMLGEECMRRHAPQLAAEYYERALEHEYSQVNWRILLARALVATGKLDAAIIEVRACHKLAPDRNDVSAYLEELSNRRDNSSSGLVG